MWMAVSAGSACDWTRDSSSGNHGDSHRDLNTFPLDQFQADVLRGAITRPVRLLDVVALADARCCPRSSDAPSSLTGDRIVAGSTRRRA
jgi:peptidoglycan/xylan/chitin deacetylase (PgdA/CDA1 family)